MWTLPYQGEIPGLETPGIDSGIITRYGRPVTSLRTGNIAPLPATFDRRFTARRMAEDYLDLYGELSAAVPRTTIFEPARSLGSKVTRCPLVPGP